MVYSAINIGPVVGTINMARKPRALWSASYLFSYLMKCLYDALPKNNTVEVISPAEPSESDTRVGLMPDRLYVKGDIDVARVIQSGKDMFHKALPKLDMDYFNIMSCSVSVDNDSDAIKTLNTRLDVMELMNISNNDDSATDKVYNLIHSTEESPLFEIAFGNPSFDGRFFNLEELVQAERKAHPERKELERHRYFCVVQADGDNMGKAVSQNKTHVIDISQALLRFGVYASKIITEYGGVPIYAGGDDLLFIAPVTGKNDVDGRPEDIFHLLYKLNDVAFAGVRQTVGIFQDDESHLIIPTLSFGVSITYYKYPLYEALASARNLLIGTAKSIGKNAIAWSLQKHSGGIFKGAFSRNVEGLDNLFRELINISDSTTDISVVSSLAHHLRDNEALASLILNSQDNDRLDSFFKTILNADNRDYFKTVKKILSVAFNNNKGKYTSVLYDLLRTAKFINGEELNNE